MSKPSILAVQIPSNIARVELLPGAQPMVRQWASDSFAVLRQQNKTVELIVPPASAAGPPTADGAPPTIEQELKGKHKEGEPLDHYSNPRDGTVLGKLFITLTDGRPNILLPVPSHTSNHYIMTGQIPGPTTEYDSYMFDGKLTKEQRERILERWTGSLYTTLMEADGNRCI